MRLFVTNIKKRSNNFYHSKKAPWIHRMIILALIVGAVGGVTAVGFYELILLMKRLFWGTSSMAVFLDSVTGLPWYTRLIIPTLGGLIVGLMVTYVVQEARGYGVPLVMEAVAIKDGVYSFAIAPLKALVTAICIGSGGSAGRVGPIIQFSASFGSSLGTFFCLSPDKVKTLLAAGAAAGVAGTINAPMAGVIFSVEVILREIKFESFSTIIIAAVTGTAVANSIFGRTGAISSIPGYQLVSYWELFFYIGLGIFTAGLALGFSNILYFTEEVFEKLPIPQALKAAVGGLMLGGLALVIPQIHSTGYPVLESALYGQMAVGLVLALMCGKILATSLTLGSGGSGGVFAPALFVGAMGGSFYGSIVGMVFPNITAIESSYGMVGIGALFAGAVHAPLTAIMIVFEITREPKIIIPLILACFISSFVATSIQKRNIYTAKLLRRGVDFEQFS